MSSAHGKCSLYLIPEQPDYTVEDLSSLITALQDIGLISHKIDPQDNDTHYYSGERFLDLIAYMGCAPTIQFEASGDGEDYCFIKLHHYDKAKLIHSRTQSRAPHCPACQKPVKDWQHSKTDATISCNLCHTTVGIEKFNWRKMAGFARLFIEITDIFPKEAIPQQLLLDKLAAKLETNWSYFYACQ
jgi:hypothetical protein